MRSNSNAFPVCKPDERHAQAFGVAYWSLGTSFLNLILHLHHFLSPEPESLSKAPLPICVAALDSPVTSLLRITKSPLCRAKFPAKQLISYQEIQNIETTSSGPKPFCNSLLILGLQEAKTRRSQFEPSTKHCQGRSNQAVPQTVQEPTDTRFVVPDQTLVTT